MSYWLCEILSQWIDLKTLSLKVCKYVIFDVLSSSWIFIQFISITVEHWLTCDVVTNAVICVCNGLKIKGTVFKCMQIYHL